MSTAHSNTLAPAGTAMWWDGGDRAITAREKATIEEHGPSCFSIALVPATDSATVQQAPAIPDGLDQVYKALDLAADGPFFYVGAQTAAGVGTHFQAQPGSFRLFCGDASFANAHAIVAALNWLRENREALTATCKQPLQVGEVQGDALAQFEAWARPRFRDAEAFDRIDGRPGGWEYNGNAVQAAWAAWQAALAARPPAGAQEPFAGALEETRVRDLRESFDVAHQAFANPAARIPSDEWGGRKDMMCPDDEDDGLDFNRSSWSAEVIASGPLGVRPEDSIVLTESAAAAIQQVLMELLQAATAAPPAQGIDLGPVREFLRRRMAQWRSHLPSDPGAPGTVAISGDGEGGYNNDVRMYREGIALMDRVLALIDDQRDAAPGVDRG